MAIDPSASVHPTAIVGEGADIGRNCRIGPYCVIGSETALGEDVELKSHVVVTGRTSVGKATRIWPFASIGHQPQDLKYKGERTRLEIGERNMIREHVTMNPGTEGGGGVTRIGSDSLYMMGAHIGHDCTMGDRLVVANHTSVSGHATVEDDVILGGQVGVHQFCRIGRGAMIGGKTGVIADVIPFGMVTGNRGHLSGINVLGLKRRGVPKSEIAAIRGAYSDIFESEGTLQEKIEAAAGKYADSALVKEVVAFILNKSSRSLTVPE